MRQVVTLASVAILGLASLGISSGWLRAKAPAEAAKLPKCPSTGRFTIDVDGAPEKGSCRASIDRMTPVSFNIPAGTLMDGLKAYLEQSGARGLLPLDIMVADICTDQRTKCVTGPIPTAGVSGTMPPREALDRLLSGTGVSYVQDQTGTFRFPPSKDVGAPGGRCTWAKAQVATCPEQ